MKSQKTRAISLILLTFALAACSPVEAPTPAEPEAPPVTPTDTGMPASLPELAPETNLGYCGNRFYPVAEGRTLEYTITSGDETSNMSFTQRNVSESAFTHVLVTEGITTEIRWECGPDGLLSSQAASMSFTDVPNVEIDTVDVIGIAIPPEDRWQVGYSWETVFNVRVTVTLNGSEIEGEGVYTVNNTITAIEPVSVPAGSYPNAYRVDATANYMIRVMGVETEINSPHSSWYVEEIGMVKSASSDAELPYSMELVAPSDG